MKPASLPLREDERLAALRRYDILDTAPEAAYDEIAELASQICETPIALVSLVDSDRQWFKSNIGLDLEETSRDTAFCSHAILGSQVFMVPDTLEDERFADNPLVTSAPFIRFYAGAPLVSPEGAAVGTLCAIDRVPRVLRADQLRALEILSRQVTAQLELRRAHAGLLRQAEELRGLNANKDKFFSILAHDLRAPFQSILMFAELLGQRIDELDRGEIQHLAKSLETTARGTYRLIDNLLQWSMLESGGMPRQWERMDLGGLLQEICSLLSVAAAQKRIQVTWEADAAALVEADRKMLHSALQNLLSNAIKFTPLGGRIHLECGNRSDRVEITVADNGVGLDDGQLKKLFRIETAFSTPGTAGENGTGLGLVLCRQLVEENGGTLTVASRPGQGTTFAIGLPKASG